MSYYHCRSNISITEYDIVWEPSSLSLLPPPVTAAVAIAAPAPIATVIAIAGTVALAVTFAMEVAVTESAIILP